MDASVVFGLLVFTVILTVTLISAQVITPPNNVTVKRGSSATFYCGLASTQDVVMWVRFSPAMEQLYLSTSPQDIPANYAVENSSLIVKQADFSDGVTYTCMALGSEKTSHSANLVVVDNLEASTYPSNAVSFDDNVTLTCSLQYGGPTHDNAAYPLSPDQDPHISIFLGSEDLTSFATRNHTTSSAAVHTKTLFVNRTLTSDDVNKELRCYVRSVRPAYNDSANISLPFRYSPRAVAIESGDNVTSGMYVFTGSLINCSADGIPAPKVTWKPVGKNPNFEILRTEPGYSSLKLVGLGFHSWNCTASNTPGVEDQAYSEFNVTVTEFPSVAEKSRSSSVGLGVGLGIGLGLLILLAIILLIVFLRRSKYSGYGKPNASRKKPPVGEKNNSTKVDKSAMIYKPQPITHTQLQAAPADSNGIILNPNPSYEQTSDAPPKRLSYGHADLGMKTLGASGSTPRLNESFNSGDERNFNRTPAPKSHSSYDDDQFYPSRYHKAATARDPDDSLV